MFSKSLASSAYYSFGVITSYQCEADASRKEGGKLFSSVLEHQQQSRNNNYVGDVIYLENICLFLNVHPNG